LPPLAFGQTLQRLWQQAQGAAATAEVGLRAPEGRLCCLSLRVAPWPHDPSCWIVTARDTSAVQRRVERLQGELERLRAEKVAWEDAAHAIAHDVRSPLAALRGFLMLLAEDPSVHLTDKPALFLDHSVALAERLEGVVARLLDRAPPVSRSPEVTDIGDLAARLFAELEVAHRSSAFTWCIEAGQERAGLPADVLWVVLWNLAENALRYRVPDRPPHLLLRSCAQGEEVFLEFLDNGRGLVPGEEEEIFGKGHRGANVRETAGSGLGLYQARRLLGEWGGRISAAPGTAGACLRMILPCPTAKGPA
jgi:K+-sensing histidine kinase KdpD